MLNAIDIATVVDHPMSTAADRQPSAFPVGRWLRLAWQVVSTSVLVLAAAAFVLLALGPHLLGYRTVTMLTGSMAPGINPGDVVVTMQQPAHDVAVGDIVTYQIPVEDHRVETHRVVKVTHDVSGRLAIVTKGDANNGADPWVATINGPTVWKAKLVVPHVGAAIRALRSPAIQFGAMWTAVGGLVLLGLRRIWSSEGEESDA